MNARGSFPVCSFTWATAFSRCGFQVSQIATTSVFVSRRCSSTSFSRPLPPTPITATRTRSLAPRIRPYPAADARTAPLANCLRFNRCSLISPPRISSAPSLQRPILPLPGPDCTIEGSRTGLLMIEFAARQIINRRDFIALSATASLPGYAAPRGRFQKSICDGIVPRTIPLDEAFRQVKRAGFDGYEITMDETLTPETPPGELKSIAASAREAGVTIVTISVSRPFSKCPLNHPDPALRAQGVEVIKRAVDIAHALNSGTILLVPSRVGGGAKFMYGYEETWKRPSEELAKAIRHAGQAKVILTMENVWNKFLLSPLEMRAFVDQFKSPWLQAHFDIGNVMQFGYPHDWILTLGPRIKRVHLKDFKVQTNRFVPLMEGDANWTEVMGALVKVGYRGWLSPEYGYDSNDPDQITKISAVVDKIYALAG